ncbi:unnamed protein product [Orchesella dallaii]|uniref:EKC/KEOPS complex subunit LAGE3 n=1 Tax=Orchesella dallaii TaxID=48710 RepID=A0ABP1PW50_9HEXA
MLNEMEKIDDSCDKATLHMKIPFNCAREAEIAYNSLRVDSEPKRSQVLRSLSVDGTALVIDLIAPDARQIRLSMNSLLDHVLLVQKVISKFSAKS